MPAVESEVRPSPSGPSANPSPAELQQRLRDSLTSVQRTLTTLYDDPAAARQRLGSFAQRGQLANLPSQPDALGNLKAGLSPDQVRTQLGELAAAYRTAAQTNVALNQLQQHGPAPAPQATPSPERPAPAAPTPPPNTSPPAPAAPAPETPEFREALTAATAYAEAEQAAQNVKDLKGAMLDATSEIRRLDSQDRLVVVTGQEFQAQLGRVYADPEKAAARIQAEIAKGRSPESVMETLRKDPAKFASLREYPVTAGVRRLWKGTSTKPAMDFAQTAYQYGRAMLKAQEVQNTPTTWTDPITKQTHTGRDEIRAACRLRQAECGAVIPTSERHLKDLGGLHGTRDRAAKEMSRLGPSEQQALRRRVDSNDRFRGLGITNKIERARIHAGTIKTLAEGPNGGV